MSNKIDRSYPGALASARGDSFLTTFNSDRSSIYGHTSALETMLELLGAQITGEGTFPGNTTQLSVGSGQVSCPAGYVAIVGGVPVITTSTIAQAYTAGQLNHVFLVLATTGVLSLRVSTSTSHSSNELWIADVDSGGVIVNEPAGKPYASISLGTGTDGSIAGLLGGRYKVYTSNGTANTEDAIAHGLGRTPIGYMVIKANKAARVYTGSTSWTSTNIYLKVDVSSAALTLLIF